MNNGLKFVIGVSCILLAIIIGTDISWYFFTNTTIFQLEVSDVAIFVCGWLAVIGMLFIMES